MIAVDTSVIVAAFASWHESGATVRHAGGRLLTRDRRAVPTYERLGVDYELIA